jgi:hypothetical protein
MSTVSQMLALCLAGLVLLRFSPRDSMAELVGATLALASVLAIPVGYLMGSF